MMQPASIPALARCITGNPWFEYAIISFILLSAVMLNNLEEAKVEQLAELRQPVTRDDLLKELAATQSALARLRERMERME